MICEIAEQTAQFICATALALEQFADYVADLTALERLEAVTEDSLVGKAEFLGELPLPLHELTETFDDHARTMTSRGPIRRAFGTDRCIRRGVSVFGWHPCNSIHDANSERSRAMPAVRTIHGIAGLPPSTEEQRRDFSDQALRCQAPHTLPNF